jgi:O-antigen ligase
VAVAQTGEPLTTDSVGPIRSGDAAVWVLAATVAIVSLVNANLTGIGIGRFPLLYDSAELPRLAVSLVLIPLVWALWFASRPAADTGLRTSVAGALLISLAVWGAASAIMSPHRALAVLGQSERLEGVVTLALYAAAFGIGLQVVRRASDTRRILIGLCAGAGAGAVYGIAQFLGFDPTDHTLDAFSFDPHRAFSTFGNPNFFAGLLVLALPCALALASSAKRRAARIASLAVAVAMAVALFATFTRGAWLGAFVGVVVFAIAALPGQRAGTARPYLAAAGIALALIAAASLLASSSETSLTGRLADLFDQQGSVAERALVAQTAAAALSTSPVIGSGPDTFLAAFRLHRLDEYAELFGATSQMNNAHSWPLQYAVTLGVVGSGLLCAALGFGLWTTRKALRSVDPSSDRIVLVGAWAGCLGFCVHMLTSVAVLGATIPFWVVLGALQAPWATPRPLPRWAPAAGTAGAAAVCCVALGAAGLLVSADAVYLRSRLAFHGEIDGDPALMASVAAARNPLSVKYRRGAADVAIARVEQAVATGMPPGEVRAAASAATRALDRVDALDGADYASRAWRASLYAAVARYTEDGRAWERARAAAQTAARMDRQHVQVEGLATGDRTPSSIEAARSVPALP